MWVSMIIKGLQPAWPGISHFLAQTSRGLQSNLQEWSKDKTRHKVMFKDGALILRSG